MVDYKVKLSDGAKASAGGSASDGTKRTGISVSYPSGGGGAGRTRAALQEEAARIERAKQEAEARKTQTQKEERKRRLDLQQARQDADNLRIRQQAEEQRRESKTTTGVYERGGAVIRETRGDYETLKTYQKQQPGSRLVQTQSGEYRLIRSEGLNLSDDATLSRINENIIKEGGERYLSTGKSNKLGGYDYKVKLLDSAKASEGTKPVEGDDFAPSVNIPSENILSAKHKVNVGSNVIESELTLKDPGRDYQVFLSEDIGTGPKPYQKTRALSAREIAEGISEGKIDNQFIGTKGIDIVGYEQIGKKESEVFPITYTDAEGKELVTITGKGPDTEFKIFGKSEEVKLIDVDAPVRQGPENPSKSIERVLKSAAEPFIDVGITLGLAPYGAYQRYTGKSAEERRAVLYDVKESYEKVASKPTGPTPLQHLIETGQPTTGRGLPSDIAGYTAEGVLLSGFISRPKIPKLKKPLGEKPAQVKSTYQEYTPARLPVSRFSSVLGEQFKTPGFRTETVNIGKGITKPINIKTTPKTPDVVKSDPDYTPARLPVSKFRETYNIREFESTKVPLGTGVTKQPVGRFTSTPINLGEGKTGFISQRISLGSGAVKTPERVLGKQEVEKQPIRTDPNYYPSRLPVSRFKESLPEGELAGYTETRISLGKGTGTLLGEYTKPKRLFKPTTPKPQPKETREKISEGLVLLMEPQKQKEFTSTKINLGKSDKVLQIQEGKVIRDTLGKSKTKPTESFYSSTKSGSPYFIEYEYARTPSSSKTNLKTIQKISPKVTQKESRSLITEQKPSLRERVFVGTIQRQPQKQRDRPAYFYNTPSIFGPKSKQTPLLRQPPREKQLTKLIEEPPPKPPRVIPGFRPFPQQKKPKKTQASKLGSTRDFLGNVPLGSVTGVYKRKEVVYGDKRISNLLGFERRGNKPKRRAKQKKERFTGFSLSKKYKGLQL